ncbi:MAG: DUF4340 domain-containing protein [Candidatus Faecousia sp.]|nr:DUF4340 domain-containing protein [Candidatus Faecousia sp.]
MKKRRTLLCMLAALAVLAALVPLASRIPEERNTEEPTGASLGLDTENLDRLTVEGEETLTFVKQGDSWIYEADPTFPLDETKITTMLDTLASLSAAKTIDEGASAQSYGLASPLCRVEAGSMELRIGSDAAMDGGRYFSTGDGKVYITADDILTPFRYSLLELVKQETAPAMETLETVTLERKGKAPLIIQDRQGEALCYSPDYVWFVGTTPLDTENTETLIRHGTDMTWEGCAAYRAEDLSPFGLENPTLRLTIRYSLPEEGTYTLEVGTAVSGQYYARMNGSRVIYWMDAADVNALLEAEPESLYPNEVLLMDWSTATALTAELAGERYVFTPAVREKQQQEAAEETQEGEQETYWLLNGEERELGPVLESITSMVPRGSAAGMEPCHARELKITIFQDNHRFPEVELCFYRNTAEDCLVTLNGAPTVLVNRADVSALYEAITKLVL